MVVRNLFALHHSERSDMLHVVFGLFRLHSVVDTGQN